MQTIEGFQLSTQQRRLWSLLKSRADLPYRACAAVAIEGPLDVAALERALGAVVARHEILRTTFQTMPGMSIPLQVIGDAPVDWRPPHDLTAQPDAQQQHQLETLWQALHQQPLDLESGPLLAATLVTRAPDSHVVLLAIAALCADAATLAHIVRDLCWLYGDDTAQADDEPLQYADFANWQSEELTADDAARAYWRKHDLTLLPAMQLPFRAEQAAPSGWTPAIIESQVAPDQAEQIARLVQQRQTSTAAFWLSCWVTLLGRLSEQSELIVGVACDGRNYEELESALGLFATYVPLHCQLDPQMSFSALIRQVATTWDELAEWQDDFNWEHLRLQPEHSATEAFFPFGFDFTVQPAPAVRADLSFTLARQATSIERCDIRLACTEQRDGLTLRLQYDSGRYTATDIQRLVQRLHTLVNFIVQHPDAPLDVVELLDAAEQQQLVSALNQTARSGGDDCVHRLFEQQVARTPDAVAARFADASLSYADLNRRANQLAEALQQLGVGPETLVGICMERSLELLVGLLAILKAGGAYVPLDPAYPQERLQFMIADAQMPVLLTQQRLVERLQPNQAGEQPHIMCVDAGSATLYSQTVANIASHVSADNLAYAIYTSGSTGQPKGVLVPHRGLVNYLRWAIESYAVADGQGAPIHSSISFDLTITGLFAPLLSGRTVELLPEELGVEALAAALEQPAGFSLIKITPAHLALLAQQLTPDRAADRTHALIIGGEQLLAEHLSFWQDHAPRTRLVNEYGPTETVVGCCVYELAPTHQPSGAVPIGRPIANTRLYVLDRAQRLVPFGGTGELYIGGTGVARGYLYQPALTADRFVPDPWSTTPGARMYKTGDLVRYLADGNLEYLGRSDQQVKLRGFRIELGEIEAVLSQHPAVRDVAVIMQTTDSAATGPADARLVAYVTADDAAAPSADQLRAFLEQRLPSYMVPAAFVLLPTLPLTTNGKIDRAALARHTPATDARRLTGQYVAPRNQHEQTLATIWADTLGLEQVGIHDSFFALGGDSILSFRMIFHATQAGLRLTLKQLFDHPTIAALVPLIDTAAKPVQAAQDAVTGPLPLTPIQRWFFEQDLPAPHHFNQAVLLEVQPDIQPALLRAAVGQLLAHHDALRLRFTPSAESWQQRNAGLDDEIPYASYDLTHDTADQQQARLTAVADELQRSLDLSAGPLLRVALFHYGAQVAGRMLIVVHHLAIDGVSWRILLDDLQTVLRQLQRGETIQLPPKTTSFKQWAERLQAYAQTPELLAQGEAWQTVAQAHIGAVPIDHIEGENTVASAEHVAVRLTAAETRALLQDIPAVHQTQINDVLLTALALTLDDWIGASVLVDLEGHGRADLFADVDLSRTVGWFTSIYPVLLTVKPGSSAVSALTTIREQLAHTAQHGISYGLLRYLCADQSRVAQIATLPQAEISFNYLGQTDQVLTEQSSFRPARESSGLWRDEHGLRRYLLDINGSVAGGRLTFDWQYSRAVHQRATIEALAQRFATVLRQLIDASQTIERASLPRATQPQAPSPLVALREEGQCRPFFCVHASGGIVFVYNELVQQLAADQPFYGLQSHGLYPDQQPDTQVERMATRYISAMRAAQPHGPYQLGGWSGGAVIAFEMAQQLHAAGEQIALLALIDQPPPDPQTPTPDETTLLLNLLGLNFPTLIDQARQLGPDERIAYALEQAKAAQHLPLSIGQTEIQHFLRIYRINSEALRVYIPRVYPGRVTLFRAASQPPQATDSDGALGWRTLAGAGIDIHVIPGDHYSMVRAPHVAQLGQLLQQCLDRVQRESAPEQQPALRQREHRQSA